MFPFGPFHRQSAHSSARVDVRCRNRDACPAFLVSQMHSVCHQIWTDVKYNWNKIIIEKFCHLWMDIVLGIRAQRPFKLISSALEECAWFLCDIWNNKFYVKSGGTFRIPLKLVGHIKQFCSNLHLVRMMRLTMYKIGQRRCVWDDTVQM